MPDGAQLAEVPLVQTSRFERGDRLRREVLGDEHVDRAQAAVTDFTRPLADFVTESCWSDVWSRPGLDKQTRSLLNIAMLTAMGRNHELGVHVRGAIRNGCSETQISETILQTAVYCGVPAALESSRVAASVLDAMASASQSDPPPQSPSDASSLGRVGFIGLGRMGLPMASRLGAAGAEVRAFDVNTAAREHAESTLGVSVVDSLAGVACEIVILMLPDSNAVEQVLMAADLVSLLPAGAIVVDMSSSDPQRTRELARTLRTHGVTLVDAPVSGGVVGAEQGTLTVMVGGPAGAVADVTPVLLELGKRVLHAGDAGAGHAAKALNNLLSAVHLLASSEAVLAGEALGIDPEVMLSIINTSSGRSGSTEAKWPDQILPKTYASGFSLALMLKDMRIGLDTERSAGTASTLGQSAVDLWAEAADQLDDRADHTEIARWVQLRMTGEPAR